jgi:hypothetical protein
MAKAVKKKESLRKKQLQDAMDKLNKTYGTGSRTRSANNRRLLSVQEYWFYL